MMQEYEQSSLATMRRLGASHVSLHGVADESFGAGIGEATNYLKNIAPGVTHPNAAPILRAKNALETVPELIGSSTNSAYFKQNVGRLPLNELASKARALSGDPSNVGGSSRVQAATATIPYLNTAIQGMRSVSDAATTNPAGFAGGAIVMFGVAPYMYQVTPWPPP